MAAVGHRDDVMPTVATLPPLFLPPAVDVAACATSPSWWDAYYYYRCQQLPFVAWQLMMWALRVAKDAEPHHHDVTEPASASAELSESTKDDLRRLENVVRSPRRFHPYPLNHS